jgi:uncharacterized repeat protein (TIGR03803 family)
MKRFALAVLLSCVGLLIGAGRLSADVTVHVVYAFQRTDGEGPVGALLDGGDGYLYGTTSSHGSDPDVTNPAGTIFRVPQEGGFGTLYTFEFQVTGDSAYAGVVRRGDGMLLGTTRGSGAYDGDVFELAPNGDFTVLHTFTGFFGQNDGGHPEAALVDGGDGNFYGTTSDGGTYDVGTIFSIAADGTYDLVHSFHGLVDPDADDFYPRAALVRGADGALYGTTNGGGPSGAKGTVFRWVAGDTHVTTIHGFAGSDGSIRTRRSRRMRTGCCTERPVRAASTAGGPCSGSPKAATSRACTPSTSRSTGRARSA